MQYLEDINQGALHKSQLNHEPGLLVHAAKPAYPRPWVQLMPPGSRAPAIVGHVLLPLEPHDNLCRVMGSSGVPESPYEYCYI